MVENKRPMSVLYLAVPGLGQVYCGRLLCGALVFLVTCLALFTWLLGSLFLLDFLGFSFMNDYTFLPLLLGLAVWAWGAYEAYTCNRKMLAGEIPWQEPHSLHIILFLVGAGFLVLAGLAITVFIYFLFGLSAMATMFSHETKPVNVVLAAEKSGGIITITNTGNETAGYTGFAVIINGERVNQSYGAEPGVPLAVNGSGGPDHVVVFMRNFVTGSNRTILDTTV